MADSVILTLLLAGLLAALAALSSYWRATSSSKNTKKSGSEGEGAAAAPKSGRKGRKKKKGAHVAKKRNNYALHSSKKQSPAKPEKKHKSLQATLAGHSKDVLQACWSPCGMMVATVSVDESARVWAVGGTYPWYRAHDKFEAPRAVAFSSDSKELVLATERTKRICVHALRWSKKKDAKGVHFPKGEFLEGRTFDTDHKDEIIAIKASKGGRMYITCADGNDTAVRFFDTTGSKIGEQNIKQMGNLMLSMSANGKFFAVGAKYGDPKIFQLVVKGHTGPKQVMKLCGHKRGAACVAFDSQGTRCATGSLDGTLRMYKIDTRYMEGEDAKMLYEVDTELASVKLVSICPNTDLLAVSHGRVLQFYKASDGTKIDEIRNPHKAELTSLEFSPDGKLLLTSGGAVAKLWSVASILEGAY